MNSYTKEHLTKQRDVLNLRLLELRAEVRSAEQARREVTGASTHEVTDRKDEATQRSLLDVGDVQEQRDLDELAQVEAALRRLDAGSYGICSDCSESISLQRLQVQPAAQRCAPCQAAFEDALERSGSLTTSGRHR